VSDSGVPLVSEPFRFRTSELDHARSFLTNNYCPMAISLPRGTQSFGLSAEMIRIGPLKVARTEHLSDMRLDAAVDSYHIILPAFGMMYSVQAGAEVIATPQRAVVYRPEATAHTKQAIENVHLSIRIEQQALEGQLAMLLDHPITGPVDLAPSMPMDTGLGRGWRRLVKLIYDESRHPHGLVHQPLIAAHLCTSILNGLLLTVPHRYSAELRDMPPADLPRALRRAIDAIHDQPEKAFTVGELAAVAGTSVRSLQQGFRQHVGATPMEYLQRVRLGLARDSLLKEDPQRTTVAAVAHRWGFTHLGRFANAYHARYGVLPSETLRRGS
jgi:AraC-like DNA-binding protein